jgi:hypothetical protein
MTRHATPRHATPADTGWTYAVARGATGTAPAPRPGALASDRAGASGPRRGPRRHGAKVWGVYVPAGLVAAVKIGGLPAWIGADLAPVWRRARSVVTGLLGPDRTTRLADTGCPDPFVGRAGARAGARARAWRRIVARLGTFTMLARRDRIVARREARRAAAPIVARVMLSHRLARLATPRTEHGSAASVAAESRGNGAVPTSAPDGHGPARDTSRRARGGPRLSDPRGPAKPRTLRQRANAGVARAAALALALEVGVNRTIMTGAGAAYAARTAAAACFLGAIGGVAPRSPIRALALVRAARATGSTPDVGASPRSVPVATLASS